MNRKTLITAMALAFSAWPLCAQDNPPQRQPGDRRDDDAAGGEPRRALPGIFGMLDANRDGALDPTELDKATEILRKLDRNGDGRVTPDEMRPFAPERRRPDGGPRTETRRDDFGPRRPGEQFERRFPDRGFGAQRFAQRSPWLRDDPAAAGPPPAVAPRFDAARRERGPAMEPREFAPPPPRMNPPGDRFEPRPPAMDGGPVRGRVIGHGLVFGQRPPPFGPGDRGNVDQPPRGPGGGERPRDDSYGPRPPQPAPPLPPTPGVRPGESPTPGAPPPRAL